MATGKEQKSARNIPKLAIALLSLVVLLVVDIAARRSIQERRLAHWIGQLPVTIPFKAANGTVSYGEAESYTMNGFTYGVPRDGDRHTAASFIEAAGTNALPYVIAELGSEDNRAKICALAAIKRWGFSPPAFLKPRTGSRLQALTAIRVLGTNASPALSSLEALTHSKDPGVEAAARVAIQSVTSSNAWGILF